MGNSTDVFVCPMHPEVKSDQLGSCPKCGMTLIPAKDSQNKPKGCECCV